jgi:hypothetical protein
MSVSAGENVPGGYPAPTPHLANVEHTPYHAPSSVPSDSAGTASTAAYDALDNGAGQATPL